MGTRYNIILLSGLMAIAAFLIYLPHELGAALTIPPDSSEYSICLANLFEHGRFGFTLNGEWYPSRYTPWFSLFCLTPAYLLSGGNVLCTHWAILAFSLALLLGVWKMGSMCGLGKMSMLPPILLLFMPDFVFYSRVAMTEIPYTALFVILAIVFVRFVNKAQLSVRGCFGIGLLIAWTGFVRSTGFTLAIPFGIVILFGGAKDAEMKALSTRAKLLSIVRVDFKRKILLILALGLPIVIAQLMNFGYNWMVFGTPFRSGYHYWYAVPMDFPHLSFSFKYVRFIVKYLLEQPIIQITLVYLCLLLVFCIRVVAAKDFARHRTLLLLAGYVFVHLLVLSGLYLGYYWPDTRFFLSITVCSVPLFFLMVNTLLSKVGFRLRLLVNVVIFAICVCVVINAPTRYIYMTQTRPIWLAEAQVSGAVLPRDSLVIQLGDPNVLDYFGFKHKSLVLFPFHRKFDYVKYMTAPKRITNLVKTPPSFLQQIIPELVKSGVCKLPFPDVFEERPELIRDYVSNGKRVFVLQSHFHQDPLRKDFESFKTKVESMGLGLRQFGVWSLPGVSPSPIRHYYDRLLFPGYSMDSRPEITVACYQIVKADEAGK